jgi:hypothetical protein
MTAATILTLANGKGVDLLALKPEDIDFAALAEHLGKEARFNGATPKSDPIGPPDSLVRWSSQLRQTSAIDGEVTRLDPLDTSRRHILPSLRQRTIYVDPRQASSTTSVVRPAWHASIAVQPTQKPVASPVITRPKKAAPTANIPHPPRSDRNILRRRKL